MAQSLELEEAEHPFLAEENEGEEEEEEEEEEALSLCDLPVTSKGNQEDVKQEEDQTGHDSDFDFGSLIGSITALESEMCAADEVFSGGQMLPFRHSVSSEVGLSGFRAPIRRSVSRSESMDRVTGLGSRSTSSRSSSTRSHQSASSSTSSGSCSSVVTIPKPKARNHFHSYPSPKPQIRASGTRHMNCSGSKSTMWQVLRLGLVRTPEMELHDLKVRCRTSPSDSNKATRNHSDKFGDLLLEMQKRGTRIPNEGNKNGGGIFGNCKCSVGAFEPILMPQRSIRPNCDSKTGQKNKLVLLDEDKVLAERKKDQLQPQQQKQKQPQQQEQRNREKEARQGKRVGSHHRTFEWLRDLSHTSVLNS